MDLHRLRVVEFDTLVSEKEGEKKYIAEHEEYKQEDWNTSTDGNKNETGNENQCLNDNKSPLGLSQKCLDDKISPTSKKYLDDTSNPPGTSIKCPDDKICPPGTSDKYLDDSTSTSPPGTSKKDNFAGSKLKSEIFKIPPKNTPKKLDLKINSSDKGLTKLFQDSAYSHQKKRTFNLRNRNSRVHQKVENVKEKKEKDEEVHVLFARETPSFIKYCKKRAKNVRTTVKKKRDFELPNDIYGFQKSNRSTDQYQYRMSYFNFINTDKIIPFRKLRRGLSRKRTPPQPVVATGYACKHHAMRVLHSSCDIVKNSSIYYNLGVPQPRRSQRKRDYDQEECFGRERSAKDETVEVSISCRDVSAGPSKEEVPVVYHLRLPSVSEDAPAQAQVPEHAPAREPAPETNNTTTQCNQYNTISSDTIASERKQEPTPLPGAAPAQNKCKRKCNNMKNTKFVTNVPLGFISRFIRHITNFHAKKKFTGESCIKYIFYGLLTVVWSPCLLAVILAWVVMFPVKLKSTLKTDNTKRSCRNHSFMNRFRKKDLRCEFQQMCFENYLPKNKRSYKTSATSWYSRTVRSVVNTLTPLLKLKKKAPKGAGSSFLPSSHPNPRRRYSLFYADNRGWVMKPLRRRNTRSSASTRIEQSMRCEVKPKLRCLKKLPQKLKKVRPCPGHDCYPRQKSSAAGDACRSRGTHPWPRCVCWDKYSQGSSMFKRRQQVNILPTFYYPTSGVAFNSADKTINPKKKKTNDIADNIAYEDLWKYHLGQRKNGTLPFGAVFNHPRGTKHPLITNLETFRAHKFGLAGKTLNMSTKYTPTLVIKGLQRQLPKFWTKTETGKAVNKSLGVHRIISFTNVTTSMPTKHISSYRQNTKREEALNSPSRRNEKSAIKNKKLHTLQKNLNFRNKSILADISQSTGSKQANTSTYKIRYAHKTQNTSKHILYHKVTNKPKETEKAKSDMVSKCAKHTPPNQTYKYKSNKTRASTQKHSSPAKIKSSIKPDTVLKRKQSKQGYKYNPDQIIVATQNQSNTAVMTTSTNRNRDLNYPCGEKHKQTKQANKYKPHQVPVATQKQSNKTDITTSTNVNIALNCPYGEKPEQSTQANKYKLHQVPVATQKQSNKADITTSTNRNKISNYPYREKHEQTTQANKYKPHQVPVAIQKQSNKADITTSTNVDIALNCPCGEKHEQSKHGYKHQPHQIPNATQMQSRTADNTTMTSNRDIALNCPGKQKHEQYKHGYKYGPHLIPNATQMQSRIADNTTMTNRDLAFNYLGAVKPSTANNKILCISSTVDTIRTEDTCLSESAYKCIPETRKHEQSKQCYKYKRDYIPVATQKQSSTADTTTMTNRDIVLSHPCGKKVEQSKQAYKCKTYIALNYLRAVKPSIANKVTLCIPSTADKDTRCTQKNRSPEYVPKKQDISIQKQASKIETSVYCASDYETRKTKEIVPPEQTVLPIQAYTYKPYKTTVPIQEKPSTADIMTNCSCGEKHKQSKQAYKYKPHQIPVATQKQSSTADITTSINSDIALNYSCGEKHEQCKQNYKYKPYKTTVPIQKQRSTADIITSTNRDVVLNYLGGVKPSTANKEILCIPSTTDKDTICTQIIRLPEYVPKKQDISVQKQVSKIETSVYCGSDYERSKTEEIVRPEQTVLPKQAYKYKPYKFTVPIQKQRSTADIITSTNRDVVLNYLGGVKPSTANKEILCIPSTTDKDTICTQKIRSPEYDPKKQDISVQKQVSKIETSVYCGSDYERSKTEEIVRPEQTVLPKQAYKYKPYKFTVPIQKERSTADIMTSTNRDVVLNYLGSVKPSTANKDILCIPSTADKDTICTQKIRSPEYIPNKQDLSVQKQASKIETSVYCASERSKIKEIVRPEQTVFPKKNLDCTSYYTSTSYEKTSPLKQTSFLIKKVTDWGWGGELGGSRKLNSPCMYKGTQTIEGSTQENKGEVEAEHPKRTFTKKMVDYGCGTKPKQQTFAIDCGLDTEQNLNKFILANRTENKPAKQPPSQKPSFVGRTLEIRRVSTTQSLSARQLQTEDLLKPFEPHASSPLFGISSDCRYGIDPCGLTPQQNTDKKMEQIATDSKNKYTYKTSSAKETPSQQPKLTQASSHTSREQLISFSVASDCHCGTNHPIVAEKSLYNNVTGSESHTAKETQLKSLVIHTSINGDKLTPHSYQNGSVHKAISRIEIKEIGTPALKKSSITKFRNSPERSPPHLLTSPPTQPDKESCKTRVGTGAQAEYPQNISIQQPKVSEQSRQYGSETTPLTNRQGLTSDPVMAHPRQTRIVTETPPTTSTDIQELACDCTCECNSVQRLESKSPQHLPSAQPDIPKISSLHRSSQLTQSSLRTRKTILVTDEQPEFSQHIPSLQPHIPKVNQTLSKFPKSPEHLASKTSQATSTRFGIASDCTCRVTPQIGQVSNPPASKTTLRTDGQPEFSEHIPSLQPDIHKVNQTLSKFPKSSEHLASKTPQAASTQFGIASDCTCGVTPQIDQVSNPPASKIALGSDGQPEFSQHIPSVQTDVPKVNQTLSKFPKSPEHLASKTSQTTSTRFAIASDCTCGVTPQIGQVSNPPASKTTLGTNGQPEFSQHLPSVEPDISKIGSLHLSSHSKQSSLRTRKTILGTDGQSEFSQHIPSLQPDIPKVNQTLSKFPKSPEHLASKTPQATSTQFGIASDCTCGVTPQIDQVSNPPASKTALGTDGQPKFSQHLPSLQPHISKIGSLLRSSRLKQSSLFTRKTMLGTDGQPEFSQHIPSLKTDIPKVNQTSSKFPKSPERLASQTSQPTSTLFGIASDCTSGATPQIGQVSNPPASKTTLRTDGQSEISQHIPSLQPDIPRVDKTLSQLPKSLELLPSKVSQATSPVLQIAPNCRCGVTPQQSEPDKQIKQIETKSKKTNTYKTSSAKGPPLQQSKLTQDPSHTLQEQPKLFGIATDRPSGNVVKVDKTRSKSPKPPDHSPPPKSLPLECPCPVGTPLPKPLPHKCRCPIKSLQSPVGKEPYDAKVSSTSSERNIVKVDKTPSKFPKSPDHSPIPKSWPHKCQCPVGTPLPQPLLHKCRCPVKSLQGHVGEKPYSTKVSSTCSERNIVKVDKTPSKFSKSPDHSPPPKSLPHKCRYPFDTPLPKPLPHKCRCPVESLQGSAGEEPYGTKVSFTSSERKIIKVDKTPSTFPKSPDYSPPPKSLLRKCRCPVGTPLPKPLPLKCRCPVETLQGPVGEQPCGTTVSTTSSERNIVKVDKTPSKFPKSPDHSPPPKSLPHKCRCLVGTPLPQSLPRKCRCPVGTPLPQPLPHKYRCPVESLQGPAGEEPYGTKVSSTSFERNIVKVDKTLSKFSKSPDHSPPPKSLPHKCRYPVETPLPKPLPHKCRCLVESLQGPAGEEPYGTKVSFTSSERNIVRVDKTPSKFPKSPDHSPPPKSLPRKCRCPVGTPLPKPLPLKCRCPVESLQGPVGEQPCGTKVSTTSSERNILKVDKTRSKFPKSLDHSPPPKSLPRKCRCPVGTLLLKSLPHKCRFPVGTVLPKSLPHKCWCPVDTLQDPVGEQPYGTKVSTTSSERNIVKVDKTRSKFPKSPDHSPPPKSLPHEFRCPVERLQDTVGEQPYGTKVNKTFSKRKSGKVDKTRSKFSKSPEHSLPQKNLLDNCPCPVASLQDSVGKKTCQRSRKCFFNRKSIDFPQECPCFSSHNNFDKRFFGSDISVLRITTGQFSIRSCERTKGTSSLNEPSSRVQYRSKVSRLVMSLRDKLFSRKISKQTKIPENPTKKSSQVNPKKVDKSHTRLLRHGQQTKTSQRSTFSPYSSNTSCHLCHCPNNDTEKISLHTRKSKIDDESNRSLFRRSHIKSKKSQNPSLAVHSSRSTFHNSCSCEINQSFSRQCAKKHCYIRQPLLLDKSYSCLRISKTSQRSSFLSHSNKLECRCHADNTSSLRLSQISSYSYPRLSQRIRSQQTKTSEHSSIVRSQTLIESLIDSTPKDEMSHQIMKTLFKRKSHSKAQHLASQRNRSQFSVYCNRSQETLSPKQSILTQCLSLSHTIIPDMCRCAAKKLGKSTSHQSYSRPQLPNHQHFNHSQKPTLAQKQSSKKFNPQYSSSLNNYQQTPTGLSQHPLNPEPLKSNSSSLFNRSQLKLLVEKIRSIADKISSNSRKNKQEKRSPTVGAQTAITFPSKYACWPEKLHQLSKKLSQLSRKYEEKISPSETPPHSLSAQPTPPDKMSRKNKQEKTSSTLGAQKATIFQSKCACWPEKLHQLSKKISQHSRKSVEKTTPSKPPPHLPSAQSTQPDKHSHQTRFGTETQAENLQHLSIWQHKVSKQSRQPEFLQHLPSARAQTNFPKIYSLHGSSQSKQFTEKVEKQFDAIPQQPEAEQVIPILSGKCRCAGEQKMKTEYSSSNKLQDLPKLQSIQQSHNSQLNSLPTDNQQFQFPTPSHLTRKSTLGIDGQPEFSQHLPSVQPDISKIDSLHCSSQLKQLPEKVEQQFVAIPQQPEAEQVIPILPGKCRCAGDQKVKIERTSNNKLQRIRPIPPNSHSLKNDNQLFQSPTASHVISKSTLGTDKQPKFSQHLTNQSLETPASKLSQPHPSQQADIPHSALLHNSQHKRKNPCKCRISKHDEQEIPNSLHKIAKNQCPGMSHYSSEKFQKSQLISCVPVTAKKKLLRKHVKIQWSEISQSSENSQFLLNPQTQVYQQNVLYQKQLSQIPTNLDKPPPGLLQQYSAGLGRTGTAEGGVQQPYPDFNRVNIRYPGHNPPRVKSEPIPGLNRQPPTVNKATPPKATRHPQNACDPCFTKPANRCAPMSPYDESALRRAYKRRPLRYTPPRQQLPRVVMEKKLKENKKKAAAAKKRKVKRSRDKTFFQCLRDLINKTEREVWPTDFQCHPMWLNALKRRPCFWIYRTCPCMYPSFLNFYKYLQYLGQMFVYLFTICFWTPILLCGYFCCYMMCC